MGVPDDYANRRIRCSKCNEPSRVPALANPAPADATSESPSQTDAVSRTQTRINTEEFFAEGKQDSVNIQLKTPPEPPDPTDEITDIEDLEMVEDTPRLEPSPVHLLEKQKHGAVSKKQNQIKVKDFSFQY
jgi:hypothetical protein